MKGGEEGALPGKRQLPRYKATQKEFKHIHALFSENHFNNCQGANPLPTHATIYISAFALICVYAFLDSLISVFNGQTVHCCARYRATDNGRNIFHYPKCFLHFSVDPITNSLQCNNAEHL